MANEFDAQDDDLSSQGIGAIFGGIGNAIKNNYNITMNRALLNMQQDKSDSDIALQHAQADQAEASGRVTGMEADQMRDYINNQKKMQDAQNDNQGMILDSVQSRIKAALNQHIDTLKGLSQDPQGQQAISNYVQQRNGQLPSQVGDSNSQPNPVVNTIMPGVGANNQPSGQPPYSTSNPPPMSLVGGGTTQPVTPAVAPNAVQPSQGTPVPVQAPSGQPNANGGQPSGGQQNLPPLPDLYKGMSKAPFGQNVNDLYMKNPNVMEAMKNGSYMIKKEPTEIEAENPLYLNENDRTVLNDTPDLKKAGYDPKDIFSQLTPQTQSLINTVGQYRATPAELTSSFGGGRQKQELVKAVQSFYPNWSDAVYDQRHKALQDFTDPNGVNGQAIVSMRQGVQHLDELTQSIDAVSNKTMPMGYKRQVPVLNAPLNQIMQYAGGDPDILALKQNINAVTEEMTKSWGGSKAGEARLANWRSTMDATNSPQGWSGLLSKTAKLWQAAADTRESMFGLAMGGQKMEDILGEGVLQPQQQDILNRVKNGYTPGQGSNAGTGSGNTGTPQFSLDQLLQEQARRRGK